MNKPYLVELDTRLTKNCPVMEFTKGDVGANSINIGLTENDEPISLTGKTITVTIKKPDATIIVYDISIINDNTINFILDVNALSVSGVIIATVEIYEGIIRQTAKRFQYKVVDSLNINDGVSSFSDYPILTKLIGDVQDAISTEQDRIKNENDRINAEKTRISNEQNRVSEVKIIKDAYDAA